MSSNIDRFKEDLEALVNKANELYYTMAYDLGLLDEESKEAVEKIRIKNFKTAYQAWYSEALYLIKQMLPERLDDFVKLYKDEKRKQTDFQTYTMSDYLLGLTVSFGVTVKADTKAALPKFEIQKGILESAKRRFESRLFDIRQLIQADFFDTELESARELIKNGYIRAAGTIAGVVLEKHLAQVCGDHKVKPSKKNPSLSDYYDALKDSEVIDIPQWRKLQHLADIRNLCAHKKRREPRTDEVEGLIEGVDKVIKTIH